MAKRIVVGVRIAVIASAIVFFGLLWTSQEMMLARSMPAVRMVK